MARSCSVSPASLATLWLTLAALAAGAQPPHEEVQHQALRPTPTPTLQDPAAPAAWHSDGSRCDSFEVGLAHARLCDAAAGQDNEDEDGGRAGLEVQQPLGSLVKRQDPPASTSSRPNIPQNAPNGGITMTQPAATAQATFYKIAQDNFITFGWNFTDVIASPTSLTLQAYCSQNGFTYPVGPTQGIAGDSQEIAWNPYEYEQGQDATPLAEASYTLRVFDERGYDAAATPGYMRPYAGTVFALYRPQKYVALADGWKCTACSAALRATHMHPGVLATAASVLFGSFLVYLRLN